MARTAVRLREEVDEPASATPEDAAERVRALQAELVETEDATRRAHIHLELGGLALSQGRLEPAVRHFREVLVLDPRVEAARRWLHDLGEAEELPRAARGRGGWLARAWARLR